MTTSLNHFNVVGCAVEPAIDCDPVLRPDQVDLQVLTHLAEPKLVISNVTLKNQTIFIAPEDVGVSNNVLAITPTENINIITLPTRKVIIAEPTPQTIRPLSSKNPVVTYTTIYTISQRTVHVDILNILSHFCVFQHGNDNIHPTILSLYDHRVIKECVVNIIPRIANQQIITITAKKNPTTNPTPQNIITAIPEKLHPLIPRRQIDIIKTRSPLDLDIIIHDI